MTELDYLITNRDRVYKNMRTGETIIWFTLVVGFIAVVGVQFGTWYRVVALIAVLPVPYAYYLKWTFDAYHDQLFKAWDKLPGRLVLLAADLYGRDESMLAAIECYEAHMPGDCPLCGAT